MHLQRNIAKKEAIITSETSIIRNPTWRHNHSHMITNNATNSNALLFCGLFNDVCYDYHSSSVMTGK